MDFVLPMTFISQEVAQPYEAQSQRFGYAPTIIKPNKLDNLTTTLQIPAVMKSKAVPTASLHRSRLAERIPLAVYIEL